jgi:hypothetical protein
LESVGVEVGVEHADANPQTARAGADMATQDGRSFIA